MNEKPLERLNYYNGQRLQAEDFKLEQDYHIRVRRWLNRSLYSAGIAEGLGVYAIKDQPRVRVTPGLAIDHLGREVILLEEAVVDVVGGHHGGGPYLTIRYREAVLGRSDESCVANGHGADRPAWGGPARILADPVLELHTGIPTEASGAIPLAALRLGSNCDKIDAVDLNVRRYIGEASANKVKQYALEGVRDIDADNSARVYFHVRGRQPTSVTLILRAEKFPSLYYTELGDHTHALRLAFEDHVLPAHSHPLDGISVQEEDPEHSHSMFANMGPFLPNIDLDPFNDPSRYDAFLFWYRPGNPNGNQTQQDIWARHTATDVMTHLPLGLSFPGGGHSHTFAADTDTGPYAQATFSHVPTANSESDAVSAGVSNVAARSGAAVLALSYVSDLQLSVDGRDVTAAAREQIANSRPNENWDQFGDGTGQHAMVDRGRGFSDKGTGPIRIDFIPGVTLEEGEHYIDLYVVGAGNGGRIHFNLYVE